MKITSLSTLYNILDSYEVNQLFDQYITNYINSGKLLAEITNKHNGKLASSIIFNNPMNVYKHNYIHCLPNEQAEMTKLLQQYGDYIYAIPNEEFIKDMIDWASQPAYWDNFPAQDIFNCFKQYNEQLNNSIECATIHSMKELIKIEDKINDLYNIEQLNSRQQGKGILYINGTVLCDELIHEELLDIYNADYLKYRSEWIYDLTKIKMPISWNDCVELDIPCIRAILYSYNIAEILVVYAGDIYSMSKTINEKLNCKVYMFDSSINKLIRTGKFRKY